MIRSLPATLMPLIAFAAIGCGGPKPLPEPYAKHTPTFDDGFWKTWNDGLGELASYDLVFNRYGQPRKGVAVTIFVKETFSQRLGVKADPGNHPKEDQVQVMKLNLVQDFATGIYDYNLMTSVFTTLENAPALGLGRGEALKVSFSSQEWCGNVYHQLRFFGDAFESVLHSYFDGEADQNLTLRKKPQSLSEDALFHWARGFAGPRLAMGQSVEVPLVVSTLHTRINHVPLGYAKVKLTRGDHSIVIKQKDRELAAEAMKAEIFSETGELLRTWIFHVEAQGDRRILSWKNSGKNAVAMEGRLRDVTRLPYWQLNGPEGKAHLEKLGLGPQKPREDLAPAAP